MQIIEPDFGRRIDLPGAGPCPRPVDIDQGVTGFSDLVSLRIYSFAGSMVIDGEAEEDEVFMVVMRGAADVAVHADGALAGTFPLSASAGPRALFMPPHADYRLTATSDVDVAYARVRPIGATRAPASFAPEGTVTRVPGYASAMDLAVVSVDPGGSVPAVSGGERFVHVRSDAGGRLAINGCALSDWQTAALGRGEPLSIVVEKGTADILTISAHG